MDTARIEAPGWTALRPTDADGLRAQAVAATENTGISIPEAAATPAAGSGTDTGEGPSTTGEGFQSDGAPGWPLADGEWGAVVLRAPNVALLLPRGAALGLAARSLAVEPPGLTLRQLLTAVHDFYAVRLYMLRPPAGRGAAVRAAGSVLALLLSRGTARGLAVRARPCGADIAPDACCHARYLLRCARSGCHTRSRILRPGHVQTLLCCGCCACPTQAVLAGGDAARGGAGSRSHARARGRHRRRRVLARPPTAARRAAGCPEERRGAAARWAWASVRRVRARADCLGSGGMSCARSVVALRAGREPFCAVHQLVLMA